MADRTAFVVGHPVAHSRSPAIHRFWLRHHGIEGDYEAIDVPPSDFATFIGKLGEAGYAGGNVTIPHKEAAFAAVDLRDDTATAIGAVNTIWREGERLCGSNTDAYGFAANLDQLAPGWSAVAAATVLGAGGAARAVIHSLKQAGIGDIRVVNRDVERARGLAAEFGPGIRAMGWQDSAAALDGGGLLVNTTSLGMDGTEIPAMELSLLAPGALVTDIVYTPLETGLLRLGRAAGFETVDGLGMLLHQAVPGFEKWFGVRPVVDEELRTHILAGLVPA